MELVDSWCYEKITIERHERGIRINRGGLAAGYEWEPPAEIFIATRDLAKLRDFLNAELGEIGDGA